ncbi:beta strand repeat-containing protein [Poriferisphaera corsica]|nr:PEP-CTERM sorting domain-containing protein [Poriferisphaera corsica]
MQTLLTAFCTLALTQGAYAGFKTTNNINWTYDNSNDTHYLDTPNAYLTIEGLISGNPSLAIPDKNFWLNNSYTNNTHLTYTGTTSISTSKKNFTAIKYNTAADKKATNNINGKIVVESSNSGTKLISNEIGNLEFSNAKGSWYVNSTSSNAYGVYSTNDVIFNNDYDAGIHVAGNGYYINGIYSNKELIMNGNFDGTISIESPSGAYNYALYGKDGITIDGYIGSGFAVTGYAANKGMYSLQDIYIGGHFVGFAEVTSTNGSAYSIHAGNDFTLDAQLAALINTRGSSQVVGIRANRYLKINEGMNAEVISNSAGNHTGGLYVDNGDITIGSAATPEGIRGYIHTNVQGNYESDEDYAARFGTTSYSYGINAQDQTSNSFNVGNITIYGNVSGDIDVRSGGKQAYGMIADRNIHIVGDLSGKLNASSNNNEAYGLYALNDITIDGSHTGQTTVSAAGSNASAFYTKSGDINVQGSLGGTISTTSGGQATHSVYSGSDININQNLSANITTTSQSHNTSGLYASDILTIGGDVTGNIVTTSTNGHRSRSLYGGKGISIAGNVSGDITSKGGGGEMRGIMTNNTGSISIGGDLTSDFLIESGGSAHALSSGIDIIVDGEYGGSINTSGSADTHGFRAGQHINIKKGITGSITANSAGDKTSGLYTTNGDITIGSTVANGITGNIYVNTKKESETEEQYTTRLASTVNAYGINAEDQTSNSFNVGNVTIHGPFSGNIDVRTGGKQAYGIRAERDININGNITGTINTDAGSEKSYAISADGDLNINGKYMGTITSKSGAAHAYGFYAGNELLFNQSVLGSITATSGTTNAYGIYADSDLTIQGDLRSEITTQSSGYYTGAVYSKGNLNIHGEVSENIQTTSTNGAYAYGLHGNQSLSVHSVIDGEIIVNSNTAARGLSTYGDLLVNGGIEGDLIITSQGSVEAISAGQKLTLGRLSGEIHAVGTQSVYAIKAGYFDNLIVDNEVNASASNGQAYAIHTASSYNHNETVNINYGVDVYGDIHLGNHNGTGSRDTINFKGYGQYNDDLYGVETININQGSLTSTNHTWKLNLENSETSTRNKFVDVNVNHGKLASNANMTTQNLTIANDGGLSFALTNPTDDIAITVTQNTSLDGSLALELTQTVTDYDLGDSFKLINGSNLSGIFDTIENAMVTETTGLAVLYNHFSGNDLIARFSILGDANLDNVVDMADVNLVQANTGATTTQTWVNGDFNGDGIINDVDMNIVTANYGVDATNIVYNPNGAATALSAIPEPSSLLLLGSAGILLIRRKQSA